MSSDYHEDSKIENKIYSQDKITSHHFHAFALELKSSAGTKVEPTLLLKDFASLIWILYTIGITNLRFAKIAGCSQLPFFLSWLLISYVAWWTIILLALCFCRLQCVPGVFSFYSIERSATTTRVHWQVIPVLIMFFSKKRNKKRKPWWQLLFGRKSRKYRKHFSAFSHDFMWDIQEERGCKNIVIFF